MNSFEGICACIFVCLRVCKLQQAAAYAPANINIYICVGAFNRAASSFGGGVRGCASFSVSVRSSPL